MGLRFRRSVRLFPGVRLNFSTRGVSATIGPRGASVNIGPRGTYANIGLSGTGLSYRERLDGGRVARGGAERAASLVAPVGVGRPPVGIEAQVRALVPLWPWLALTVGGVVVATLATSLVAGLGGLAAGVGLLGAVRVPRRRAVVRARLLGLRPEG